MRSTLFFSICFGALFSLVVAAGTPVPGTIGQAAPHFTPQGSDGKTISLSDYKGKFVVLEWTNPDCPFVHKFYDSHTMQGIQKQETGKGVVWLRVNSSAQNHEGFQSVADLDSYIQ